MFKRNANPFDRAQSRAKIRWKNETWPSTALGQAEINQLLNT